MAAAGPAGNAAADSGLFQEFPRFQLACQQPESTLAFSFPCGSSGGCILVVKNYPGLRFNHAVAAERARSKGAPRLPRSCQKAPPKGAHRPRKPKSSTPDARLKAASETPCASRHCRFKNGFQHESFVVCEYLHSKVPFPFTRHESLRGVCLVC